MKDLKLINQKMALQNIRFERFDKSAVKSKIIVKDSVDNIKIDGNSFSFSYKRNAYFEPTSLFSISVEFIYVASIDDDSYKALKESGKEFDIDFIKGVAPKIINNTPLPIHASLVISNNTSLNGALPLVTQPFYIE